MDADDMDNKNISMTAKAAAIGSGNEIGYWTKARTDNED